jgi:hypothetical protein
MAHSPICAMHSGMCIDGRVSSSIPSWRRQSPSTMVRGEVAPSPPSMSTARLLPRPSTFTCHASSSTFTATTILRLWEPGPA